MINPRTAHSTNTTAPQPGPINTLTSSGISIDLSAPDPADIDFSVIAWSLGHINRFSGHAMHPYSVAQHSLLVRAICAARLGPDVHSRDGQVTLLHALLHDAHEALMGDITLPTSEALNRMHPGTAQAIHDLRASIDAAIWQAAGLEPPDNATCLQIYYADRQALATEIRDLFPDTEAAQNIMAALPHPVPSTHFTCPLSPSAAADAWCQDLRAMIAAIREHGPAPLKTGE